MSRHTRLVAGVAALAATGASWRLASAGDDNRLDVLADAIRAPRGTVVDWFVAATTDIGSVFGLVGMAGAVGAGIDRSTAAEVVGAGSIGWVLGQSAKPLAQRQRPYQIGLAALLVHPPAGSSWPSGHTAVASAVATVLSDDGPATAAVAAALAGWVGLTRIYVGAHHPTDIVGGAGIGILSGLAAKVIAEGVRARWLDGA